ncbi:oligosaccharide flippase family protein [Modestobacter sp. I12A-02628]|uniref:Oligosaccharide flippase family protein n=1 Tax=Goekera deserti TaxID=2497753 RepID=A0A7K3WHS3_9ACTN|nr:oligosaccharide flippase family protein [Goekera deserti]NDI48558.1 oligosaccharide flippase family protein [Goekera deserti]NEL55063.1 oligosaccharide flippase family protein [Goekera deserti]
MTSRDDAAVDAPTEAPPDPDRAPLRRAVLLMTFASFFVPFGGLLSSPLLAQGLGVAGRGEVAAALAPGALLVSVATLGLPEALTYHIAKRPEHTRSAVAWASAISLAFGAVCLLVVVPALPFLSAGDPALGRLVLLGSALALPAMLVNVLRGAAQGRQMWGAVAAERLISVVVRLLALLVLFLVGGLTAFSAVVVSSLALVVCGISYVRLLGRPPRAPTGGPTSATMAGWLLSFGVRVWMGAAASMLLARTGQLLVAPLSDVEQLGLFVVAVTVSDVPLIVSLAVRDALFGVNSKTQDAEQLVVTARATWLLAAIGSLLLGATLPLWIGPLFGAGFTDAILPTLVLTAGSVVCVPGILASAGLGAWGRPGLRSAGLAVTLAVNLPLLVVLVPLGGAVGAAVASFLSNVVFSVYMTRCAARVMQVRGSDFVVVRGSDVALLWRTGLRLLGGIRSRLPGRSSPPTEAAQRRPEL